MSIIKSVLVTGGAGYIVKVLDLYLFGDDIFDSVKNNPKLSEIKGGIRNQDLGRASANNG